MSSFYKKAWCRFCGAEVKHSFLDNGREGYSVLCNNCGQETPERAFARYEKRHQEYINKLKQKKWDTAGKE